MEIKKAYKLTVDGLILDEPWHYEVPIYYALTAGEAKSKGMDWFRDYRVKDYSQYDSEREITFTDIKEIKKARQNFIQRPLDNSRGAKTI